MSDDLEARIALNLIPGLGPALQRRAIERFGSFADAAYRAPPAAWREIRGVGPALTARLVEARRGLRRAVARELRLARRAGARLVTPDDAGYPAALLEIPDPPPVLALRGELPDDVVRVAIVGSRGATRYGRSIAESIAAGLVVRGIEVVSGGARGVDTAAHRGALEEGGRTIAVLGSGLARPYPEENAKLFERIAECGALVSEFPMEAPPLAEQFPRRNRIVSGLAAAVVVVEAAARSGSLSTARHAGEQGREVLAVPGPVSSPRSAGTHALIRDGATLVRDAEDVLEGLPELYRAALGLGPASAVAASAPRARRPPPERPDEREALALLDPVEPTHIDELADRAPFGLARLQLALFGLEVEGRIEARPGGWYVASPG